MSNKVAPSPLYDVLKQLKSEIFSDFRVCVPGTISGLDLLNGTVSVKIGLMQKIAQLNFPTGQDFTYPELTGCPVFTVQGGKVGAVMPVSIGDGCLVIFSDRAINNWFTTGQAMPLPSLRMHDIADGFVLVGVNPETPTGKLVTSLLPDGSEGGICETKAAAPGTGAKVAVNPLTHKISISNGPAGANSLLVALTALTTALEGLTINTVTGAPNPPFVANIVAVQALLVSLLY